MTVRSWRPTFVRLENIHGTEFIQNLDSIGWIEQVVTETRTDKVTTITIMQKNGVTIPLSEKYSLDDVFYLIQPEADE